MVIDSACHCTPTVYYGRVVYALKSLQARNMKIADKGRELGKERAKVKINNSQNSLKVNRLE